MNLLFLGGKRFFGNKILNKLSYNKNYNINFSSSSYHGYYTKGGALEVGQSSTRAVVYSIILIMISNYILTQLLLL